MGVVNISKNNPFGLKITPAIDSLDICMSRKSPNMAYYPSFENFKSSHGTKMGVVGLGGSPRFFLENFFCTSYDPLEP